MERNFKKKYPLQKKLTNKDENLMMRIPQQHRYRNCLKQKKNDLLIRLINWYRNTFIGVKNLNTRINVFLAEGKNHQQTRQVTKQTNRQTMLSECEIINKVLKPEVLNHHCCTVY